MLLTTDLCECVLIPARTCRMCGILYNIHWGNSSCSGIVGKLSALGYDSNGLCSRQALIKVFVLENRCALDGTPIGNCCLESS